MNYRAIWDGGYAKRHARIMATRASYERKCSACQRAWRKVIA